MIAASPKPQEPSMEEILASIRRIIADDQDGPKLAPAKPAKPEPPPVSTQLAAPEQAGGGAEPAPSSAPSSSAGGGRPPTPRPPPSLLRPRRRRVRRMPRLATPTSVLSTSTPPISKSLSNPSRPPQRR